MTLARFLSTLFSVLRDLRDRQRDVRERHIKARRALEQVETLNVAFENHARGGCDVCLTALRRMDADSRHPGLPIAYTYCGEGARLIDALYRALDDPDLRRHHSAIRAPERGN